ncbi:glycosyltransferase [Polaribacter sp. 20A6]|uniref:glycosyltransferase n=1 Tax=Polaribacter sp. 20A6 TaxID=2687289 RepID=UPI0013FE1B4C|nr:glycosyltransferase [Polaribacter sp. 20A6]
MNKLIFDPVITGHHSEYIGHLVDYIATNPSPSDVNYIFVINPAFKEEFLDIVAKAVNSLNITWVYVTPAELELCSKGNLIKKSFNQYKVFNKYALLYNVKHAVILYFNTLQLALILKRPNYTVSGILFLQFHRMQVNSFKEKVKYYRKYYTTYLYTLNKNITRIHVLNDKKSADFLNENFNTDIFKKLPDPIPQLVPITNFNIYEHYNISRDQKIFLHIGGLADRKGTFDIIKATEEIPREVQSKIVVLLVGKANGNDVEEKIKRQIMLSKQNTLATIIWDNQFVPNSMMKSLFDNCNIVLMPYKNPEASSGILGHAMASDKKVITTGQGLLKEMVLINNLGYLLSEVTSKSIASKMCEVLNDTSIYSENTKKLVANHHPKVFSQLIV